MKILDNHKVSSSWRWTIALIPFIKQVAYPSPGCRSCGMDAIESNIYIKHVAKHGIPKP